MWVLYNAIVFIKHRTVVSSCFLSYTSILYQHFCYKFSGTHQMFSQDPLFQCDTLYKFLQKKHLAIVKVNICVCE